MHRTPHSHPLATFFLAALFLPSRSAPQDGNALVRLLPQPASMSGWRSVDTPRVFEGEDLFSFIDGGASLFLEYGFRRALAAEYRNSQEETMNLEVYEMKDAGAAYGIYSVRCGGHPVAIEIGQNGTRQLHYIMFWKDKYYVSVAISDTSPQCESSMESLSRAIASNISTEGRRPPIMDKLPRDGLLKAVYARGMLALSTVYSFDSKDILQAPETGAGLYSNRTVIIARYEDSGSATSRFKALLGQLRVSDRYDKYRQEDVIATFLDRKSRTLCLLRLASYIVISISPQPSTAISSCRETASILSTQ